MKRLILVVGVMLVLASCHVSRQTVDINDITFDTLRVKVLIFDGDTLSETIRLDK